MKQFLQILIISISILFIGCKKDIWSGHIPEKYKLVKNIFDDEILNDKKNDYAIELIMQVWSQPVDKVCLYNGGIKKGTYFLLFKYLREYKDTEEKEVFYTERFKQTYWKVIKFIDTNFNFANIATTEELHKMIKEQNAIKLLWLKDNSKIITLKISKDENNKSFFTATNN